jgi:hypothetical protein
MIRALYHAFKLYIKIHGETFCCLTFLGEKNFDVEIRYIKLVAHVKYKQIVCVISKKWIVLFFFLKCDNLQNMRGEIGISAL